MSLHWDSLGESYRYETREYEDTWTMEMREMDCRRRPRRPHGWRPQIPDGKEHDQLTGRALPRGPEKGRTPRGSLMVGRSVARRISG